MLNELDQAKRQEVAAIEHLLQTLDDYKAKIFLECHIHFSAGNFGFVDEFELPDKREVGANNNKDIVDSNSGNIPA